MTEPQVWVLMGVFATAIFGMLTWQTVMFNRTLDSSIGAVRAEIGSIHGEIGRLSNEIDLLRTTVDSRFEVVNRKIDSLDRDVQVLTQRVFGSDPR